MFDLGKLHFAPDAGKYRTDNALICALLSALSYKREAIIRTTLRDNGFRHVHYFTHEKVDTQCLIASKDKTLFAVFRGTQVFEMKDWNTNRKVLMVGGPLGKIHRGFLLALTSVWAEVSDCIDTLLKKHPDKSLWLTGHSLGGALATIACAYRIDENLPIGGVYTFGQPRVGDGSFSRNLNRTIQDRFFRVANHRDIVTRLPPRVFGYDHAGQICYFDKNQKLHLSVDAWNIFLNQMRGIIDGYLTKRIPLGTITDHSIGQYVRVIRKNRPSPRA
ncbi:lipase family protein [Oscillatoria amoena NRMC-F 0135]|nr:lipase family protein [Oscillatoria laete-virens]MDL5050292.1 lipase family protein [Oscillatoria amoena NRMC-F 0135]MDL5055125.1 lipase family protein [Oscillatoria laete-virens NRMC-F 0139]